MANTFSLAPARDAVVGLVIIAATIAPVLLLSLLVYTYALNIPYYDQWSFIPLLEKQIHGTLQLKDILALHNEHRLVLPRLIFLFFANWSGWNIRIEQAANIVTATGIFGIIIAAVYRLFRGIGQTAPRWSVPILSVIIFSLTQWQNWLWGWQLQIFLCIFFTLLGFFFLKQLRLGH